MEQHQGLWPTILQEALPFSSWKVYELVFSWKAGFLFLPGEGVFTFFFPWRRAFDFFLSISSSPPPISFMVVPYIGIGHDHWVEVLSTANMLTTSNANSQDEADCHIILQTPLWKYQKGFFRVFILINYKKYNSFLYT